MRGKRGEESRYALLGRLFLSCSLVYERVCERETVIALQDSYDDEDNTAQSEEKKYQRTKTTGNGKKRKREGYVQKKERENMGVNN